MRLWPAEKAQLNSWMVLHENVQLEHVDPHGDLYGPARVEQRARARAPPQPGATERPVLTSRNKSCTIDLFLRFGTGHRIWDKPHL